MTLTRVAPAKGHGTLVLPSLQKLAKQELLQEDQSLIEGANYLSDMNFGYMPPNQEQQLFDETRNTYSLEFLRILKSYY